MILVGSVLLKSVVCFCVWLRQSWVKRPAQSAFFRVKSKNCMCTPSLRLYFGHIASLKSAQFALGSSSAPGSIKRREGIG